MPAAQDLKALKLVLPPHEGQSPHALLALARKMTQGPGGKPLAGKLVEMRSLRQLKELVLKRELGSIRLVEWLAILGDRLSWTREDATYTALPIWQKALDDGTLLTMIVIRLTRGTDGAGVLDRPMIEAFAQVKADLLRLDRDLAQVVDCLTDVPYAARRLAELGRNRKLTPRELVLQVRLNPDLPVVHDAIGYCLDGFIRQAEASLDAWVVACLETQAPTLRREAVKRILTDIPKRFLEQMPLLVRWIRDRFGPGQPEHACLDTATRNRLRDLMGAITYRDFERLVKKLATRYGNIWAGYELNRLERRCAFWSNYQDSFRDLKVFLPSEVKGDLDMLGLAPSTVSILDGRDIRTYDHTQSTEVCVFETDEYLLIEFFRGNGSETAIIRSTETTRNFLFKTEGLSVKKIRRFIASHDPVKLDHVFLWQGVNERALHARGIRPGDPRRFIYGMNGETWAYQPETGIASKKSEKDVRDRAFKLRDWEKDMQRLYDEARSASP